MHPPGVRLRVAVEYHRGLSTTVGSVPQRVEYRRGGLVSQSLGGLKNTAQQSVEGSVLLWVGGLWCGSAESVVARACTIGVMARRRGACREGSGAGWSR